MVVELKTIFSFERRSTSIVERNGNPNLTSTLQRTNLEDALRSTNDTVVGEARNVVPWRLETFRAIRNFTVDLESCRYRQFHRVCCPVNQFLARTMTCSWSLASAPLAAIDAPTFSRLILMLMQETALPLRTRCSRMLGFEGLQRQFPTLGTASVSIAPKYQPRLNSKRLSWIKFFPSRISEKVAWRYAKKISSVSLARTLIALAKACCDTARIAGATLKLLPSFIDSLQLSSLSKFPSVKHFPVRKITLWTVRACQ